MHSKMQILPWNATTLAFLLAGKCYTTIEDVLTGERHTYEIVQKVDRGFVDDPEHPGRKKETIVKRYDFWFVSFQHGAIGESKPRYLGVIDTKAFRTTKTTNKNPLATANAINAIGDVIRDLRAGKSNGNKTRIWHCGRCGRCARDLSVPSSIATGLGPDCAKQMGIEMVSVKPTLIEKLAALDESA